MSARELFRSWGVSQRCYEEFLRPTLLVGLFAPPEDISAASMLETLYFYGEGGRPLLPAACPSLPSSRPAGTCHQHPHRCWVRLGDLTTNETLPAASALHLVVPVVLPSTADYPCHTYNKHTP
jgi:hypothetical protein